MIPQISHRQKNRIRKLEPEPTQKMGSDWIRL